VLDIYGEFLNRQGRTDDARPVLERATHALAPYPSLKAKLAVYNFRVAARVCLPTLSFSLYSILSSDVCVCFVCSNISDVVLLRSGISLALFTVAQLFFFFFS